MDRISGNVQLIQKINRLKVLNYIRKNPDVSRPVVARETGLSVASLTNISSYLLEKGLITENGTESVERVGRKGTLLRFCAEAYGLICIFPYSDKISISYTDLEGRIREHVTVSKDNLTPQIIIDDIPKMVYRLIKKYGREQILGIGIAIPGVVLHGSRFVLSTSLKWTEFDLKETIEKETGIPVFIENISVLKAVWYFCCGKFAEGDNMLLVDLEDGIGACQYYKGEINRAMLGEIGHTTVEKDGEQCFCGNRGCLEAMCSVQRIERLYAQYSGRSGITLREIADRYADGEKAAKRAMDECAGYLGIGLANLVNLCMPSVIVINIGSFAPAMPIIKSAERELLHRGYPVLLRELIIKETSINEEQAICGTAFHICNSLFDIAYPGNII